MNDEVESKKPLMLDIGCGQNKIINPHYEVIGIDIWENSDADLNISAYELPFEDESIDLIYTRHFFEHFSYDVSINLFNEFYRVLRHKSNLEIIVPHVSCISAFQDPTHKAFFTKRSFYKYQHTGFIVKKIIFFWFRNPYKGRFPFLVNTINKLLNMGQKMCYD